MRNPLPDKKINLTGGVKRKPKKIIPSESLRQDSLITWNWASPSLCSFSVP